MGVTFVDSSGNLIPDMGGPYQERPDGSSTGLPVNSRSVADWDGHGGNYTRLYETQIWVSTVVNFLVRQFCRPSLKVYERDSQNNRRRVRNGQLADAIRRPSPRHGAIHLMQWLVVPALIHGNGTVRILRDEGGRPRGFRPLPWSWMEAVRDPDTHELLCWIVTPPNGGQRVPLLPSDVLHLAWHPPNGGLHALGVSPLKQLGVTLQIEAAAQRYQAANFRNGARPSGGVTLPEAAAGDLQLRRELRSDIDRLHAGEDNAGRPVILPPGAEWQSFGHSATDVGLIEQRKLGREECAAAYGAPQPSVGILDHATYSNITELRKTVFGETLGPWFNLTESAFDAQVIAGEPELEGQWVEFELYEVLRGDPVKEAMAAKTEISIGVMTINEYRRIRNRPSLDIPEADLPIILAGNDRVLGQGKKTVDSPGDAIASNLKRASERMYRRAKANGDPGWDPERFVRELGDDLKAAGVADPGPSAQVWANAVGAIVADSLGEPAVLRESIDMLADPSHTPAPVPA